MHTHRKTKVLPKCCKNRGRFLLLKMLVLNRETMKKRDKIQALKFINYESNRKTVYSYIVFKLALNYSKVNVAISY